MAWGDVGVGGGGGNFLKLKAGEKTMLHVLSEEPTSFFQHFFQSINRGATCPGQDCPACASGQKEFRKRAQHVFVVYDYKDKQVKLWAMGNETAEQVKNVYDTYDSSLAGVDLQVTRTGTGRDTKYGVVPKQTRFQESFVEGQEQPDPEESSKPASAEDIQQMMEGVNPAESFDPEKLEETGDGAKGGSDDPWGDEAGEKTPPAPAKPSGKGAWPTGGAKSAPAKANGNGSAVSSSERMQLIRKVMHAFSTKPAFKDPKARLAALKKVSKKTITSQLSIDELKVLAKNIRA